LHRDEIVIPSSTPINSVRVIASNGQLLEHALDVRLMASNILDA
jgi:hypothetical protein